MFPQIRRDKACPRRRECKQKGREQFKKETKRSALEMDRADLLGIRNAGERIVQEITERLLAHAFLPTREIVEKDP